MTPRPLARAVIDALPLEGRVLDPSRGDGAFYDQFPTTVDKEWCELSEGRDFMDFDGEVDWVVTNPPWSKYRLFSKKAYACSKNVAYLVSISHDLSFTARLRDMREANYGVVCVYLVSPTPKKPWPQTGFQLGVVWKQRDYTGDTTWRRIVWEDD